MQSKEKFAFLKFIKVWNLFYQTTFKTTTATKKRAWSLFQATKKKILTLLQNTYERPIGTWKLETFATKNYSTSGSLCSSFKRKFFSYKVKLRLYYYWKNKSAINGINRITYLSVTTWNALPVNSLKRLL